MLFRSSYDDVKLSPDGRLLAFDYGTSEKRDLWVYDIARTTSTRLTFESDNFYPTWSPDGKRVVFASRRKSPSDLYSVTADGSGQTQTVVAGPLLEFPGTFSPDGRTFVFRQTDPMTGFDIFAVQLGDTVHTARPVVRTRFNEMAPAISPDGKWLAYVSDETGHNEVYLRRYPAGESRWAVSVDGGSEPVWRRDGRELFFRNGAGMHSVTIESDAAGTAPSIGRVTLLFNGPYVRNMRWADYDVTPDGREFVMVKDDASSVQLQVATDWRSLLSTAASSTGGR